MLLRGSSLAASIIYMRRHRTSPATQALNPDEEQAARESGASFRDEFDAAGEPNERTRAATSNPTVGPYRMIVRRKEATSDSAQTAATGRFDLLAGAVRVTLRADGIPEWEPYEERPFGCRKGPHRLPSWWRIEPDPPVPPPSRIYALSRPVVAALRSSHAATALPLLGVALGLVMMLVAFFALPAVHAKLTTPGNEMPEDRSIIELISDVDDGARYDVDPQLRATLLWYAIPLSAGFSVAILCLVIARRRITRRVYRTFARSAAVAVVANFTGWLIFPMAGPIYKDVWLRPLTGFNAVDNGTFDMTNPAFPVMLAGGVIALGSALVGARR